MAFVKSGYRYHTKYDDFWNIPLGSFQHAGDNALSLVRNLANAPELSKLDEQPFGKVTFFDIFGWFMVSYNDTLAIILNLLGILISLVPIVQCFRDFELSKWFVVRHHYFNAKLLLHFRFFEVYI